MVWRGRDETDARRTVTRAGNRFGHLVTRKLTTLAGLGALGHLDLQLVGV